CSLRVCRGGSAAAHGQGDGVGHGLGAGGVGGQAGAAVVGGQDLLRAGRVAQGLVEVDHAVEGVAGAAPLVDRFALGLTGGRVVGRTLERGQGGAEDLQTGGVGGGDDVPVAGDDLRGRHVGVGRGAAGVGVLAEPDVVDALEHDHVAGAAAGGHVAGEAGLGVHAEAGRVVQDPVAADAFVGHGPVLPGGQEPAGQGGGAAGVGPH